MANDKETKCVFCTGESISPLANNAGMNEKWLQHQYHQQGTPISAGSLEEVSEPVRSPIEWPRNTSIGHICDASTEAHECPVSEEAQKQQKHYYLECTECGFKGDNIAHAMRPCVRQPFSSSPPTWEQEFDKTFLVFEGKGPNSKFRIPMLNKGLTNIKAFIAKVESAAIERGYEDGWKSREKVHETLPTYTPREYDDVYKQGLSEGRASTLASVREMVENPSYVGVLDSNEKRRGYDCARMEFLADLSTIEKHNE